MAAGLPSGQTVEFEQVPGSGTWTDITTFVTLGVTINEGRSTPFDSIQPGTMTVTVENIPDTNGICQFTPDNPRSTYYPNLVEGRKIRVKVTKSATTYTRFTGYITSIAPNFAGELNTGTVTISAVDLLGIYAGITMVSDYTRLLTFANPTQGVDIFPFTETGAPTQLGNVGNRPGGALPANVVNPGRGSTIAFGTDSGLNVDGIFTTKANNPGAAPGTSSSYAPVITFNVDSSCTSFGFWLKTATGATAGAGNKFYLMGGSLDPAQYMVGLVPGSGTDLLADFFDSGVTTAIAVNDNTWHYFRVAEDGGGNWLCYVDDVYCGSVVQAPGTGLCYLGGQPVRNTTGYCLSTASWGGLYVTYDTPVYTFMPYATPNQLVTGTSRLAELALQSPSGIVPGLNGSDSRQVVRQPTAGLNLLDAIAELARTMGVPIFCTPDGVPQIRVGLANRSTTVLATITFESDDDATGGLPMIRGSGTIPTRVTVSCPFGSSTVTNPATDGVNGVQRATSLSTCAPTLLDAEAAGNALLYQSSKLRIAGITVDLSTAQTDLYSALLTFNNLVPGARLRLANVPSGGFGWTYLDVYVQGWTETLTATGYVFTFDTTAADAPPDGLFDDATYGRFASSGARVTGGTCVGITGTGTVIVTTDSGVTFTTAAGAYPMDLDWNGERITVSAPGGSSSPQTFTCTARGVSPSVARVHSSGETLDVWMSAHFAL